MGQVSVTQPYARPALIARKFAAARGIQGREGGWIYFAAGGRKPICQGWDSFALMFKHQIRDWLTVELTAFGTFAALINAGGNYRPTLRGTGRRAWWYAALADYYDEAQANRGDARRACRI